MSLDAGVIPSIGDSVNLGGVRTEHAVEVVVNLTSGGATPNVYLEGSLDGVNWYSVNNPPSAPIYQVPGSSPVGVYIVLATVTGQPALYVRATSNGSGGDVTTTHTSS